MIASGSHTSFARTRRSSPWCETDSPDRHTQFKAARRRLGPHRRARRRLSRVTRCEKGRLPPTLLPLQSGVGNVANAVLAELDDGPFRSLTAYTEVIQDGMLQMLQFGNTGVRIGDCLLAERCRHSRTGANIDSYRERIVLRSQEISNHPEVIRRLGCLAMNGMIEADIYGNVNSTHIMGSSIQNGIGGSGDFARNALHLIVRDAFDRRRTGTISCIVPMVSHVDHTEHDVHVIVTEQGVADLRGLAPRASCPTDHRTLCAPRLP